MNTIVECYYTVQQLAWMLQFDRKTILEWVRAGKFGADCLNVEGKDVRVPASGVRFWELNHRIQLAEARDLAPIVARTLGELKRKACAV